MKTKHILILACIVCGLSVGAAKALAQAGGAAGGGGGFGGGRNMDPADFQKMMLDNIREQLEVKDDGEWKVVGDQVQKVFEAKMQVGLGGGMAMGKLFRRPGGNNGGGAGGGQGGQGGGGQGGGGRRAGMAGMFGGQSDPEAEALQKAIDANASNAELKAAVAKFAEARKQKQARLEASQADLRKLLSVRQEAIAFSLGLL
jgi:hypothetical protein